MENWVVSINSSLISIWVVVLSVRIQLLCFLFNQTKTVFATALNHITPEIQLKVPKWTVPIDQKDQSFQLCSEMKVSGGKELFSPNKKRTVLMRRLSVRSYRVLEFSFTLNYSTRQQHFCHANPIHFHLRAFSRVSSINYPSVVPIRHFGGGEGRRENFRPPFVRSMINYRHLRQAPLFKRLNDRRLTLRTTDKSRPAETRALFSPSSCQA